MKSNLILISNYCKLKIIENNINLFNNNSNNLKIKKEYYDKIIIAKKITNLLLFKFKLINLSLSILNKEMESSVSNLLSSENILNEIDNILIDLKNFIKRSKLNEFEKAYVLNELSI